MEEQLSLLIRLQEIDTEIKTLAARKDQLPKMLAGLEQKREANQENLNSVKNGLLEAQKKKRDRDQALEAGAQKVERLKARTSEIKTNKEYQALLKEIEAAELENKSIEDEILLHMEKIDGAAAAIAAAEKESREVEACIVQEQKMYEAAMAKAAEDLQAAERKKQELASRVQPAVLAPYQRLLANKSGTAIVEVRGESCSGCFMSIPPQVFVNVKKNESIINCPQCGRILYYKEAIEI